MLGVRKILYSQMLFKMKESKIDIYRTVSMNQVPRILGLGDREPNSKTFGCFDRYYWHYRLTDTANARFQESALLLSLLYRNSFEGNIFYNHQTACQWALGAIEFWAGIQRRDGSFDEVYPNEHSFVATAFSTYAITESMLILDAKCCLKNVAKAGNWLNRNENIRVANQMAGALLALHNIYLLTEDERFQQVANDKLSKLLELQTNEGFFPEYGGYDIGYLSICISYLAKYYQKSQDQKVYECLNRAIKFVEGKLRDDGSYDYSKTSRGTQYLYPHGFMTMAPHVIEKHIAGLESNRIVNPGWMDDRFCIPMTIDYLQTYLEVANVNDDMETDNF